MTTVDCAALDKLESNPVPLIVKLRPPAVPPCELDKLATVKSYVNDAYEFE